MYFLSPFHRPRQRAVRARLAVTFAVALVVLLLCAGAGRAGAVTFLDQIERLRQINALLLDLRPGTAPLVPAESQLELVLDLIPNPALNNRVGAKDEPIDPPPLVPRGRLRYVAAGGWMLGATAQAPVPVGGYAAVWLGVEAGWRRVLGPLHAELRGFAIQGTVRGPLTSPSAQDTFRFSNHGADLRAGLPLDAWSLYAGVGGGVSHSEIEIASDGARDSGEASYAYGLAGVSYGVGKWAFTVEQDWSESFLAHLILSTAYRW